MKTRREFTRGMGAAVTGGLLTRVLPWVGGGSALLWPRRAEAATVLNPQDPSNFTKEGTQGFTPGSVLTLEDGSIGDYIGFYGNDVDAVAGSELDIVATFQIRQTAPNNVDTGNRIAINDGISQAAIAACIESSSTPTSAT